MNLSYQMQAAKHRKRMLPLECFVISHLISKTETVDCANCSKKICTPCAQTKREKRIFIFCTACAERSDDAKKTEENKKFGPRVTFKQGALKKAHLESASKQQVPYFIDNIPDEEDG